MTHFAHDDEPNVWRNVRQELRPGRHWLDRTIVFAYAVLAGLSVVLFTWLTDQTFGWFNRLYHTNQWLVLIWTPLCTMGVVWVTRRWFAKAAGSGIPQVMVALEPDLTARQRGLFVSLPLSVAKIVLSALGLLGGLSVGREGPSVQVAAGVMLHARRWLRSDYSEMGVHALLVAGGAGGLAATFNAPLAGVVFALEELGRKLPPRNSGLIIAVIVLAGVVGISFFGNHHFLGTIRVPPLDWRMLGPGLLVTLYSGLLGGLFSRVMAASLTGAPSPLNTLRQRHPLWFAGALGLLIAAMGLATNGATFGGGAESARELLAQQEQPNPLFVPLKFMSTWLTAWSGVPGGIFAPSLAVGAGVGHDVARHVSDLSMLAPLVALGMTGFLAAVTQAPLTAFIIVMEMVDGGAMVLSLMTAAMLASRISRLISRPLYPTLAAAMYFAIVPLSGPPRSPSATTSEPGSVGTADPAPAEEPAEPAPAADAPELVERPAPDAPGAPAATANIPSSDSTSNQTAP